MPPEALEQPAERVRAALEAADVRLRDLVLGGGAADGGAGRRVARDAWHAAEEAGRRDLDRDRARLDERHPAGAALVAALEAAGAARQVAPLQRGQRPRAAAGAGRLGRVGLTHATTVMATDHADLTARRNAHAATARPPTAPPARRAVLNCTLFSATASATTTPPRGRPNTTVSSPT